MADAVKMVIVDGIRYRPEDAPKEVSEPKADKSEPKADKSEPKADKSEPK